MEIIWYRRMFPIGSCLVVLCVLSAMTGCGDESARESTSVGVETKEVSSLDSMRAAIRSGDWKTADQFSEAVLISHSDDPEVLSQVARVAHENKRPDAAIGLLVDAAQVGELADVAAVRRAVTGLISVGRVFDAMELLAEAVKRHPDQNESRRWLFDFLVIFERHTEAVPHGRELVRRRKFDAELLIELSNTEKRDLENDSLDQMVERNPDDKRPLIGAAKKLFDQGKLVGSEAMLREILDVHPLYLPAQLLRGRTLADLGRFDELEEWSEAISGLRGHDAEWMYWSVQGDWARFAGDYAGAARAYWEATRRNADVALVWAKLASTLRQMPETDGNDTSATQMETTIDAAQRRANRLSQAIQAKKRFDRAGRDSRVEAANVASTLFSLGRPWEAEAWAAIALGFPASADEPEVDVNAIRQKIVKSLRRDTPWQVIDERTELACDLSHLPKPKHGSSGSVLAAKSAPPVTVASVMPTLQNEAVERGLKFFGRTRDDLDQPGIPIYAELGCGGGAIDFDLDGWCDLYLSAAGGTPPHRDSSPNALWRNLNGRLIDIGSQSGTTDMGFGQGVAVGDLNEDGFPDLLVLNYGENVVYINNGDGTFSDATADLMPGPLSRWSSSGAIADVDGDGLSDIVVLNYCAGLDPVTDSCVDEAKGIHKSCAPIYFSAEADNLFHNRGDGTFTDVTEDWGFEPAILGRGLGVVVSSLDGSPGLDIFVANDMSNNHYYSRISSDSMRLVESGISRGLATDDRSNPQASMGIATADMDRDGDLDIYITNFEDEYNTFHQQNGSGFWLDRTLQQNLSEAAFPMVGFGSEAVDFDNDGLLELVVANGHVDFPASESESEYLQPMQVYYQDTDGRFSIFDTARSGRYLSANHSGRALWTIDIDRNGKVDLVVTHQTEPVALLVNQTETDHHRIAFRLVGRSVSRDAIGAVVVVEQEDHRWTGVVSAGDGYLCSNERVVRFGLGANKMPVTVNITWPDGSEQRMDQVAVDREWTIVQGQEPF
ncbi:ASPIC/UnbV domain-containing protein [Rhodopirellula sallentina SM41]|uniref:ASPIC/UnbV domain-containing protein n=2 Tax=Rhodopirellula TaxID=265488 RepID=M5U8C2_9BACT|nr:ASPIC/UnbV domain-containing protein [Rhodopirellula sallentina SM41]